MSSCICGKNITYSYNETGFSINSIFYVEYSQNVKKKFQTDSKHMQKF